MVWLKIRGIICFSFTSGSLKPLALKWSPLRLSDNALQQVFHNQNQSWYFWKMPESCQHICLGWMTDSFGQVLLPRFPFPNKIWIKIKPSVDCSSHPSSKYFFLHFLKWPSGMRMLGFFHCCHFHLLFITKQIEGFYWYWYMSDLYMSKTKGEKHFGMWKYRKYKEGMERNRKGEILCEIQFIKKNAERTHLKLEITICIKWNKVASGRGIQWGSTLGSFLRYQLFRKRTGRYHSMKQVGEYIKGTCNSALI